MHLPGVSNVSGNSVKIVEKRYFAISMESITSFAFLPNSIHISTILLNPEIPRTFSTSLKK